MVRATPIFRSRPTPTTAVAEDAQGTSPIAAYTYIGSGTVIASSRPEFEDGLTLSFGSAQDDYAGWDRRVALSTGDQCATGGLPASAVGLRRPMTSSPHRKLVRHFGQPGHAHELTFSCYRRLPLLNDPAAAELLAHAIDQAGGSAGFVLLAYVFMPEHVHLLVWPTSPSARISRLLAAIKRPHSCRVRRSLEQRRDPAGGTVDRRSVCHWRLARQCCRRT